jgi:hypothetical protein
MALALLAAAGCSGRVVQSQLESPEDAGRSTGEPEDAGIELPVDDASEPVGVTGVAALDLSITPGATVNSLTFTCSGPGGIPDGTINFAQPADSVTFVIGGISPGAGYTCSLMGLDLEGGSCAGTTPPFAVVSGTTTRVHVDVICTIPSGGPDMNPDAAPANDCPGIVSFTINPTAVRIGNATQLSLVESAPTQGLAPDGGHAASNVAWSSSCATPPCGTFATDSDAGDGTTSSFVCGPTPQAVTLTAEVREYRATTDVDGAVSVGLCSGTTLTKVSETVLCTAPCGCLP